ncbi:unnamed protein product, partial [Vitrella brassicaformis CCMP3155]
STIASCSEDKTVIIWTQEMEGQPWKKAQVIQLDGPVRRVDWSVSGSLLAVACADKQVLLYKENLQGKWEEMITNLSHTQAPPPLQQQQHGQPEELLPAAPPEGWLPGDERRVPMWAYLMRGERDLRDGDTDDQAAAHRMQQVLVFGGVKQLVYESQDHGASVNGVAWAPCQYGPYLASASSDGKIGILHHSPADQQWVRTEFHAHTNGVNAVSWAPSGPATQGPSLGPMRMVSGGADNQVKLWQYDDRSQKWVELAGIDAENGHTDVIRDVAWRPNIVGAPSSTIASCSEDKTVIIWTQV